MTLVNACLPAAFILARTASPSSTFMPSTSGGTCRSLPPSPVSLTEELPNAWALSSLSFIAALQITALPTLFGCWRGVVVDAYNFRATTYAMRCSGQLYETCISLSRKDIWVGGPGRLAPPDVSFSTIKLAAFWGRVGRAHFTSFCPHGTAHSLSLPTCTTTLPALPHAPALAAHSPPAIYNRRTAAGQLKQRLGACTATFPHLPPPFSTGDSPPFRQTQTICEAFCTFIHVAEQGQGSKQPGDGTGPSQWPF